MRLALIRTPLWRSELRLFVLRWVWRALTVVAYVHRRTMLRNVCVIAVVGSYGKTTTVRMVAAALGADGTRRHPAQKLLGVRRRDRYAVIEVGIRHPGEMARHARLLRPDVTVVTSIGSEHNRWLRSLEVTRSEKAAMVRALRTEGLAVLNADDPNVLWMASQTKARIRTFGLTPGSDVTAGDVVLEWPRGTRFVAGVEGEAHPATIRLLGRHLVHSALAALVVARECDVETRTALARIELVPPTERRLEAKRLPGGAVALYDHFKSPVETVDAALDVLAEIDSPGRKLVVLGDVEEPPGRTVGEVEDMYERLGRRVASVADEVVFVHVDIGSRPTYEQGARRAGSCSVTVTRTVQEALASLPADLGPGDVVLVKGAAQQRFDRLALGLEGRRVGCALAVCEAWMACRHCPMLERGWA